MRIALFGGAVGFGGWLLMAYTYVRHILTVPATDSRMLSGQVVAGIIGAALLIAPLPFAVTWARHTQGGFVGMAAAVAGVVIIAWLGVGR